MNTLAMLLALSLSYSDATSAPEWLGHYGDARAQARDEGKPIAVFIGSGKRGWQQVSRDGELDREVSGVLAESYVCLYIDTASDAGRDLASAFGMSEGPGVVISNHTGKLQAFRHQGDLDNDDLTSYLRRYADGERAVRATETTEYQPVNQAPVTLVPSAGRSC